MATNAPRLSVILPNYNHARQLEISLTALAKQTRLPDEIIVIDDGSTDDSIDVIERFAAGCPAFRLVRLDRNQGVVAALDRGLAEAVGDMVMFASADERVMPHMCEELLGALQRFPDALLAVSGHTEWFAEAGELRRHGPSSEHGMWYVEGDVPEFIAQERFHLLLQHRYVSLGIHTAMFRRQAIFDAGGFHRALRWHSDWFLIYAVAFRHGFVAVPRHFAWYRVAPQSYSAIGVRDRTAQQGVARAMLNLLATADFADVRDALLRSPQAMSPLLNGVAVTLLKTPSDRAMLARVARFWLREVARGRRPGSWARLVARVRGRPTEPPRVPIEELHELDSPGASRR